MGGGASSGVAAAITASSDADLKETINAMSPDVRSKLEKALKECGAQTSKPKVLFVLGGPGVGKGTQCGKIIENFSLWAHISAGDCLRAERNNPESKDGELINTYIKEGKIVPVEITVKLMQKAMDAAAGKTCFLIDGFPRNMDNVAGWEKTIGDQATVAGVLFYEATEEELEKRLLSRGQGRDDDNIESIKKRFVTYMNETKPVVDSYKDKGQVFAIDGMQSVDDVWGLTKKIIEDIESKP